jgi:hypothetical protein
MGTENCERIRRLLSSNNPHFQMDPRQRLFLTIRRSGPEVHFAEVTISQTSVPATWIFIVDKRKEREQNSGIAFWYGYSCLSASVGATVAARRAGT